MGKVMINTVEEFLGYFILPLEVRQKILAERDKGTPEGEIIARWWGPATAMDPQARVAIVSSSERSLKNLFRFNTTVVVTLGVSALITFLETRS